MAYTIAGDCRVSVLDEEGRLFIDDVSSSISGFPAGLPYSIQLGPLGRIRLMDRRHVLVGEARACGAEALEYHI